MLPKFLYSTFLSMKTPSRNVFGLGSFSECSDDVRSTDLGRKGGWGIQPEINFLDQRTTAPSSRTRLSLRHLLFSAQRAKFPQDSEIGKVKVRKGNHTSLCTGPPKNICVLVYQTRHSNVKKFWPHDNLWFNLVSECQNK